MAKCRLEGRLANGRGIGDLMGESATEAARLLGDLLGTAVIAELLDRVGDAQLRDLLMKVQIRTRDLAADGESAGKLGPTPALV